MKELKILKSITDRSSKSLDKYLNDIAKESLITQDEEVELAKQIKAGDEKALKKLIKANLRFVVSVAKQYQNYGLTLPDLINEGNLGLIESAKRFDETKGFKFISYAVWWIRQSIYRALADNSRTVRVPSNHLSSANKIRNAFQKFEQKYEREPTASELEEILHISKDNIKLTIQSLLRNASLDAPITKDENAQLSDIIPDEDIAQLDVKFRTESLRKELERVMAKLTIREQKILKLFFGLADDEMSIKDISKHLGLSIERVRQIKERAIVRLRRTANSNLLKTYLV